MQRTGSLIFRALRCGGSCSLPDRGSGVRPCADAGGGLRRGGRRCKEARRSKDARRIGGRRTPPTWGHSSLPYLKFRLVCGHVGTQFTEENGVGSRNELAMLATIGPSFSVAARTASHSGSTTNAFHFASRSVRLSHASK